MQWYIIVHHAVAYYSLQAVAFFCRLTKVLDNHTGKSLPLPRILSTQKWRGYSKIVKEQ